MRVLVTAGGTREPIDDVRVIANTSTGRLGARVADALHAAGHQVLLLHGQGAALPRDGVARVGFRSSGDLAALLREHVPGTDAVVHAAAVSDFVPERTEGKLSSDAERLVLTLRRAPKLVDALRDLQPGAVLVGFKLTSGASVDERVAAARRLLVRARLDLVVTNEAGRTGEDDHEALFVTGDDVRPQLRGKAAIAESLRTTLEALQARRVEAS